MGTRRTFTPEFKAKLVLELLSGTKSAAAICREHTLKPDLLSDWRSLFLKRAPLAFQSEERHDQEQMRIAELERLVGQQAMALEILKRGSSALTSLRSRNER